MIARIITVVLMLGICGCSDQKAAEMYANEEKVILELVSKSKAWRNCRKTSRMPKFSIKEKEGNWYPIDWPRNFFSVKTDLFRPGVSRRVPC